MTLFLKKKLISPLRRRGERVQKIAEKIRYLRRDAFADDPLEKKQKAVGFLLTKADTDVFTEELEYASIL